jgi:hypothetical protein
MFGKREAPAAGKVTVTAMYAAQGMAARRPRCVLLCANRSVDLLRVNSALCTASCRAHCQG